MSVTLPPSTLGTITIPPIANPESMIVNVDGVKIWVQGEVFLPKDATASGSAARPNVTKCVVVDGAVTLGIGPGTYNVAFAVTV